MPSDGKRGDGKIGRRKVMKLASVASFGGIGATASAAASQYSPRVIRVKGSYNSPVHPGEAQGALERAVDKSASARPSLLNVKATSEFQGDNEVVEYIARVSSDGRVSQYYGASSEGTEAAAHANGSDKEDEFLTSDVTVSATPDIGAGPAWDYIDDFQAHMVNHWGELNHNLEWYRVRDGSYEERNAFRSLIASTDGTINKYQRNIKAEHDWGESELGDESIHSAGPSTTHNDGYSVSIGFVGASPSGSLSWEAGGTGDVDHSISNAGPKANWTYTIPKSGTSWFYPGSHVVANRSDCGNDQKVITARADANWGFVYNSHHNWHITTYTC